MNGNDLFCRDPRLDDGVTDRESIRESDLESQSHVSHHRKPESISFAMYRHHHKSRSQSHNMSSHSEGRAKTWEMAGKFEIQQIQPTSS
jgi:hypothetical protein